LEFCILPPRYGEQWVKVLDSAAPLSTLADSPAAKPGDCVPVASRCLQVFSRA
jgi:hypothetical protein